MVTVWALKQRAIYMDAKGMKNATASPKTLFLHVALTWWNTYLHTLSNIMQASHWRIHINVNWIMHYIHVCLCEGVCVSLCVSEDFHFKLLRLGSFTFAGYDAQHHIFIFHADIMQSKMILDCYGEPKEPHASK